jgi:hypothetical protein
MRTTLDIQDDVLQQARVRAAETRQTLGELVSDALRQLFEAEERHAPLPELPVARESAIVPGADLSPRGLKDLLDDDDLAKHRARP